MHSLSPIWTVVFVAAMLFVVAIVVKWQNSRDRSRVTMGDTVIVVGSDDVHVVTGCRCGYFTLDGLRSRIFDASALAPSRTD